MANTSDVTAVSGDLSIAVRQLSTHVISTLMQSNIVLTIMAIMNGQKPDAIFGVGDPNAAMGDEDAGLENVLTGLKLDPTKIAEIDQCGQYSPMIDSLLVNDFNRMVYRSPVMAQPSNFVGSVAPTIALTVVNGVITAASVSGGTYTSYSGAAPTLIVVDAVGSSGTGASLTAVIVAGLISSVTVNSGGQGYAASGATTLINTTYQNGTPIASAGQFYTTRPVFKWQHLQNRCDVYNDDINSAIALNLQSSSLEDATGAATFSLVSDAIRKEISLQAMQISNDLWYGTPTTQSATFWDYSFGLLNAVDDGSLAGIPGGGGSTQYAGIDRTTQANYWWRSKVDTANHPFSFGDIVDDANINKGLMYQGSGVDLFVTTPAILQKWKAKTVGLTQEVNIGAELRELGRYGFRTEVLQYGNSYAIADWRCPAGVVLGLNRAAFVFAFRKGQKFAPSEMYDQRGINQVGFDGSLFYINTQIMPMLVAPPLCVKYTSINP